MKSIGRFRRVSKDLEEVCVEFMEELKPVWGHDQEATKALQEMREVLSGIQATLNVLSLGLNRLGQLQVRDRRGRLKVVKGARNDN